MTNISVVFQLSKLLIDQRLGKVLQKSISVTLIARKAMVGQEYLVIVVRVTGSQFYVDPAKIFTGNLGIDSFRFVSKVSGKT